MTDKKSVKIGIFGLSRGASLIDCILINNGNIVAVCDKNEALAKAARDKAGKDTAVYTDFDEFINHGMDAVLIANYFPEHAEYAIRALEKGIHVLSECIPAATMADCVRLVRAAEKSSAKYMLLENYPYMTFNRELKRIYDSGTLGKALYAEGEYNHPFSPHDTEFLKVCRPYETHWRNHLPRTYYITHSLAPLMHITGAKPKRVTAMPIYSPLGEEYASACTVGDMAAIITSINDDDSVFRVTGCAAFGAHENSYRICGTNGQAENVRGADGKIMLRYNDWQIPEGMQSENFYLPESNDKDSEFIKKAGHDGGDYFVIKRFFEAIINDEKPDFDVYFAVTVASVGILAHRSLLSYGTPVDIPDFRNEEDRVKYENDTLSPFYGTNGEAPTIADCSHPDFRPSADQVKRYLDIVSPKK